MAANQGPTKMAASSTNEIVLVHRSTVITRIIKLLEPSEHDFVAEGLSYGKIHMLAGDFYGTDEVISYGKADDGKDDDHETRFMKAFNSLAVDSNSPAKARAILDQLAKEAAFIKDFVDKKKGSAKQAWDSWNDKDIFEPEKDSQIGRPGTGTDYKGLLKLNIDHFGANARLAYEIGHKIAITTAKKGDLQTAYAQNAFAEHFLQDYFASGHMRTPRRQLMVDTPRNICDNLMHNEDNDNGLNVIAAEKAPKKRSHDPTTMTETYRAFGDDSLLESKNLTNLNQAIYALQVSADEIYDASQGRSVPEPFAAFSYTATPESVIREDNNPCPMFWLVGNELQMRLGLADCDSSHPPTIPNGNWKFESVVQSKVLFWWIPTLLWDQLSETHRTELAWSCIAWTAAPPGYYRNVAYRYLMNLLKELWDYVGKLGDFATEVLAKIEKK